MKTVAFFLEELSAKEMLKGLVPRILPADIDVMYFSFEGKQDLEKQLPRKLRSWQRPDTTFVILRDKDSGHGPTIKANLVDICRAAGTQNHLVRIACHELESWYLGDLLSVERALAVTGLEKQQNNKKFRTPDLLANASEELVKITKNAYQKVSGSREIGKVLRVEGNLSYSFNVFISGIRRI
jgi:hypothetical protein